jgi:polysaccharide chain length determinant protein (PEP-CTERM system associated)
MHDTFLQILSYARTAWRYRWHAQVVAWSLCVVGWAGLVFIPNQYESTARVYVDTQSMLRPLLQGLAVQTDINVEVRSMMRTLLSRPNLEKVARETDLDLTAKTPEEMERLIVNLSKKINLTSTGQESIFGISYRHTDPEMARKVVQSVLTLFVERSLGSVRSDSSAAQQFIDQQIAEYEARLLAAEENLKEFKRQNVSVMPSEGRGYYDQLQEETVQLEKTRLSLEEAEKRRDELERQLSGEEPTFGIVQQPVASVTPVSPIARRIETMETNLDEMLLKYTESHPDVVRLKAQIAELQAQEAKREREELAARPPSQAQTLESNPVYQSLKVSLGTAEVDIAALRVRLGQYQARVNRLNRLVDTVPQVEAELARLNRDYAINKQNYETLIARRESAKISEQAEQSSDNLKFKIVDPPRVPLTPVSPSRPLLATAILIAGLGMGAGFAILLSQVKPTYDNHRSLMSRTNVPVLGYVSMVWTPQQRLRKKVEYVSYAGMGLALFAAYGAYMVLQILRTSGAQ